MVTFLKAKTLAISVENSAIIFEGLRDNRTLISLDLSGNDISSLNFLFSIINTHNLEFYPQMLSNQIMTMLIFSKVEILPTTRIEELFLNANKIQDNGIIELRKGL